MSPPTDVNSKWLPIDTAPTDGNRIIGLTSFGPEVVKWVEEWMPDDVMGSSVFIYDAGWIGVETDSSCIPQGHCVAAGICPAVHQPTHWQPFPTVL